MLSLEHFQRVPKRVLQSRNPNPKLRAIPWSRGLFLASHLLRILSIPNLAMISFWNPESRASNEGNHVSRVSNNGNPGSRASNKGNPGTRETYWGPSFHCGQHLGKFIATKERFHIRTMFNPQRIGLKHQHGHRFIVFLHQYGEYDVMLKFSNDLQGFTIPLL